jgi:hypothetical protein
VNKKLLAILTVTTLPIAGFFIYWSLTHKDSGDKFITSNPIDLDQISAISQFRSCIGHDYSGYNTDEELEENRSMKHYIEPSTEYSNSAGKVKVFAPFDGYISEIVEEESGRGKQVWLDSSITQGYYFVFFHIDLESDLSIGSQVGSGDLIGYANLEDAANFDIALKKHESPDEDIYTLDSPFNHMSSSVLKQYSKKGITTSNIIMSKKDRDKILCEFGTGSGENEWIYLE